MFTLASKSYFAISAVAFVSAVLYASNTSDAGSTLLLVAIGVAAVFCALGTVIGTGPSDIYSYPDNSEVRPGNMAGATPIPALGALGVAIAAFGFALGAPFIILGAVVLAVMAIGWGVSALSDHPDADTTLPKRLMDSIGLPFVMPLALLVLIGLAGISISRTLLSVSPEQAWIIAIVFAVCLLIGAFVLASRKSLNMNTVVGTMILLGIILALFATYGLTNGPRSEEKAGTEKVSKETKSSSASE